MSSEEINAQNQQLRDENDALRRENAELQRELAMATDWYEHEQLERAYQ